MNKLGWAVLALVLVCAAFLPRVGQRNTAIDGTLTVSGTMTAPDTNGMVYAQAGGKFPKLCDAMAYAAANANRRSVVYDLNASEAWDRDPFSDPACGNRFGGAVVWLGSGNFVQGTGAAVHVPSGLVLHLGGRAAETQISKSNGCGTSTPTQCAGTLIMAYTTAAPFTGANAMTCAGCKPLPANVAVLEFGNGANAFGTIIEGPGTISCAGVAGSIGIRNSWAQEQSHASDLATVGCQDAGIVWEGANAQNSYWSGIEVISGNLTGKVIGTPAKFNCFRIAVNAPNRSYGDSTCNPRGDATKSPIEVGLLAYHSTGGVIHDIHFENVKHWVVLDWSRDMEIMNLNNGSVSVDNSVPVAAVKLCAASSPAPCTAKQASTHNAVLGLVRISPNVTASAIVDDTNAATGTVAWSSWNGSYRQGSTISAVSAKGER